MRAERGATEAPDLDVAMDMDPFVALALGDLEARGAIV
jgi:hypothetical protein